MAFITVSETVRGHHLPVHYWGQGEDMDREAYAFSFDNAAAAEKAGRTWAAELEIEFRVPKPYDREAVLREIELVKKLRAEEDLDLRTAIAKAREILAQDA